MDADNPQPDTLDISAVLGEAAQALGRAVDAPPLDVQVHASQAEKLVVRARDELIDRLHQKPDDPQGKEWNGRLAQVNGILSLIVGIEYPSSFVRRELITQAREHLEGLSREG